ncbi:MAG: hypothetical protein ACFFDW_13400 [Candidatus Thorarchaeota archaeon]
MVKTSLFAWEKYRYIVVINLLSKKFSKEVNAIEKDSTHGATFLTLSLLEALAQELIKNEVNFDELNLIISRLNNIHPEMTSIHRSLEKIASKIKDDFSSEKAIEIILNEIKSVNEREMKTAKNLAEKISHFKRIMILSSSLTIDSALIDFKKELNIEEIIVLESRPLYEGRNTAKKLMKVGYQVTLIIDAAAGFVARNVEAIILGADTIFSDGAVLNKVGSFNLALIADYYKIPLIVGASTNKQSKSPSINYFNLIEEKNPKEIWKNTKNKIKRYNFYFDLIPVTYITEIVSEK